MPNQQELSVERTWRHAALIRSDTSTLNVGADHLALCVLYSGLWIGRSGRQLKTRHVFDYTLGIFESANDNLM